MSEIAIEDLFAISKNVTETPEWKQALDEISRMVRRIFIFDNLVVYLAEPSRQTIEVVYARAAGRGRSAEADMTWGENVATQILQTRQTVITVPSTDPSTNRLERPYILGIPLKLGDQVLGAIIFIRFGGPEFLTNCISLAEFIAQQITLLIERQNLLEQFKLMETERQQARLQQDFVSTISHELRSPLGFIKGYTTTLLRSDTQWDQKTQQEFLTIIDQEADHMQELIENLLDSARLQSGQLRFQFQIVRLDALMNDVILRSRLHHPYLKIKLELDSPLRPIIADPVRLAQVIENLIGNAKKYAPGSDILITLNQDDHTSKITVKDFGAGISEKYLPFIFDRFFRSPDTPNIHGSGLGLYICRQIIQAHHGVISAESIVDKGTTILIVLPNEQ